MPVQNEKQRLLLDSDEPISVTVDASDLTGASAEPLKAIISRYGRPISARAFADFQQTNLAELAVQLYQMGFTLVHCPTWPNGDGFPKPVVTDILAQDLRDQVEELEGVDTFLVVANSREYIAVANALRRHDKRVVVIAEETKVARELRLCADEFVSLTVEWYAYQLLETLRTTRNGALNQHKARLLELIRNEISYRRDCSYPSIQNQDSDNEVVIFRKSVLKKYVENVLYLTIRSGREGTIVEQSAFAIAAGLSMVFATAVAFLFQQKFGNLTIPFFVALVISYMFKDRIKEILRVFLSARIRRFFFDRRLKIFSMSNDSKKKDQIGVCRESVEFVREANLPLSIWKLRDRDHITEIENGWVGEAVILFRKQIRLYPEWFRRMRDYYPVDGINDIIRINFSKYHGYATDRNTARSTESGSITST